MKPVRVVLVDDHILFRAGLVAILASQPDFRVVGEAGDGLEAIQRVRELVPDIVLMDIHMPKCSGIEAVEVIKQEFPHMTVVMLTVSKSDQDLFLAIKNGADGYLLKNVEADDFLELLRGIREGKFPFSDSMAKKILQEFREPHKSQAASPAALDELTARERDVLQLVAKGATNQEIAANLVIAEDTVRAHLRSILKKLHLRNRVQAAVYAVQQGQETSSGEGD